MIWIPDESIFCEGHLSKFPYGFSFIIMILTAIYSVGFWSNSTNQALKGVLYLWLVCHMRIDMEVVLVKVIQSCRSLLQMDLGVSIHFNEAAFPKPTPFWRFVWVMLQFCTLCSRYISGSQVNEEWGHIECIQASGCRVAKNEAGELSSICHSSTEISSLEVDVAESLFAELQSSWVHRGEKRQNLCVCLVREAK